MTKSITRIAVAGAALMTFFAGTVTTAQAAEAGPLSTDKTISLRDGRGAMTIFDGGDMFQVCDTKADGHGVVGRQFGSYQMQLSWNGGAPRPSPGGSTNEPGSVV
ncbi:MULTISPECIES: hypothetical protein [unclassified Streptomyces]|uniref:hypothetical protein n=1 Tax=unclassified Streptomyces TaxID=2593676 RepID=UPI00378C3260